MRLSHIHKVTHTQTRSVPYQWEGERSPFTSCINYEWQAKGQRERRGHFYGQNIDLLPQPPLSFSLSCLLSLSITLSWPPLFFHSFHFMYISIRLPPFKHIYLQLWVSIYLVWLEFGFSLRLSMQACACTHAQIHIHRELAISHGSFVWTKMYGAKKGHTYLD